MCVCLFIQKCVCVAAWLPACLDSDRDIEVEVEMDIDICIHIHKSSINLYVKRYTPRRMHTAECDMVLSMFIILVASYSLYSFCSLLSSCNDCQENSANTLLVMLQPHNRSSSLIAALLRILSAEFFTWHIMKMPIKLSSLVDQI